MTSTPTHRVWPLLLEQTLAEPNKRQARLGIASDALLLAGVIRGLAAPDLPLSAALIDVARRYFEQRPRVMRELPKLGARVLGEGA